MNIFAYGPKQIVARIRVGVGTRGADEVQIMIEGREDMQSQPKFSLLKTVFCVRDDREASSGTQCVRMGSIPRDCMRPSKTWSRGSTSHRAEKEKEDRQSSGTQFVSNTSARLSIGSGGNKLQ